MTITIKPFPMSHTQSLRGEIIGNPTLSTAGQFAASSLPSAKRYKGLSGITR